MVLRLLILLLLTGLATNAWGEYGRFVHGFAMHGEPKYGPDFSHFDYVNPNAPRGGDLRLAALGTFDTFNSFNLKGSPAAGLGYLYETLMTSSSDEAFTRYGLIAEAIFVPEGRSFVEFRLNPKARFHDGSPITPADVIFSFDKLKAEGRPLFRFYYRNVERAEQTGEHQVKFTFTPDQVNMELPLIVSELPVLPKAYWEGRDFTAATLEPPVGSGPYLVDDFEPGRYIRYRKNPNYWGADLPVNRGQYNFASVQFDYYRDNTVALEAFKAGDYDWRFENRAKDWATAYDIPALEQGALVKAELPHNRVAGMQGFVFNTRRELFRDPRVRRALGYAFDFEWSNTNLFFGQYTRTRSYFDNSDLAATGLPSPEELEVLHPLREELPEAVFSEVYQTPSTPDARSFRANLGQAVELLRAAGWTFVDRRLVHGETQAPFAFEILLSQPTFEPVALPFVRNLERLGIEARVRTVDSAQYENRLRDFDFDMIVATWGQSSSPGNEQRDYWGSEAATTPGSRNYPGLQDPAVDALVEAVITAPDRDSLITRVRALDRALQWSYLVVPHWHLTYDRVAYWNKLRYPDATPRTGMALLLNAWWYDEDLANQLSAR